MITKIGIVAGEIWHHLDEKETSTLPAGRQGAVLIDKINYNYGALKIVRMRR